MMNFTEADVQRTMDALIAEGADADPGLHASWRCFDKVRYPEPCTCIRQAAEDILIAVADPMRDRWLAELIAEWASGAPSLDVMGMIMPTVEDWLASKRSGGE